ncbi:MAG: lysophospholipid acyltransferase family protein [Negativicutes bacterium]
MYEFLKVVFGFIFTIFFRWKVSGVDNIPKNGGVLICANHISLLDPPVIATAVPRQLHYMAKEELFRIWGFGRLIRNLNAFPVRRGTADRTAIRTALGLLIAGEMVGMFPEGTRSKTGILGNPEPGVSLIAARAGVPIVPAAITGTNQFFCNGKILPQFSVKFGKPIPIEQGKIDKEALDALSQTIMSEIGNLLKE